MWQHAEKLIHFSAVKQLTVISLAPPMFVHKKLCSMYMYIYIIFKNILLKYITTIKFFL